MLSVEFIEQLESDQTGWATENPKPDCGEREEGEISKGRKILPLQRTRNDLNYSSEKENPCEKRDALDTGKVIAVDARNREAEAEERYHSGWNMRQAARCWMQGWGCWLSETY